MVGQASQSSAMELGVFNGHVPLAQPPRQQNEPFASCIHQLSLTYLYYLKTVKVVQGVEIYKGNKTSGCNRCGDEKV